MRLVGVVGVPWRWVLAGAARGRDPREQNESGGLQAHTSRQAVARRPINYKMRNEVSRRSSPAFLFA
jgi:hypothetical protein